MAKKNDGGPAYPGKTWIPHSGGREKIDTQGMSLRDYFAGQALPKIPISEYRDNYGKLFKSWHTHIAYDAYKIADAMIEERGKK
jgi:hypothetical protein